MKTLLTRLFVIAACTLFAGTSMAEVARITGKTCKDHLRGADLDITEAYQLNEFYKDNDQYPGAWKAQMRHLEVKEGMQRWAVKHIQDMQSTIETCEQHCKGLKFVSGKELKCKEQLPSATAEQLHHLIRSESQLKDDAEGDVVEFPPVAVNGEPVGGIDETLFTEQTSNPAPTIANPSTNTLDESYFRSNEDSPTLQRTQF